MAFIYYVTLTGEIKHNSSTKQIKANITLYINVISYHVLGGETPIVNDHPDDWSTPFNINNMHNYGLNVVISTLYFNGN